MGLLDSLTGKKPIRRIPPGTTFRITQQGKDKVQEQFSSDPEGRVLTSLETGGTSNTDEIARNSGLSRGRVERIIPKLVRGGYVRFAGSSDIEDE